MTLKNGFNPSIYEAYRRKMPCFFKTMMEIVVFEPFFGLFLHEKTDEMSVVF